VRVIVNTSPLIALDRIRRLDLLRQLFGRVVRPQSVLDEIEAGRARTLDPQTLFHADWIITEPDPPEMILRKELGSGETAALALAVKTGTDLIVLDDLQARLVAAGLGLKITGTAGVILAAHQAGFEPDLGRALHDLVAAGFHLSPQLLRQLKTD
jgi:hypothetical protein